MSETTPPLDATARAALRAKAEAARDAMAYAACRVLDGEMDHEANAIASRAQGEFLHAVSSPAVILALLAAAQRGEEDTARLEWLETHSWRMDNDGDAIGPREHPMLYVGTDRSSPPITADTVRAAIDAALPRMTLREAFESVREENEGAARFLNAARAAIDAAHSATTDDPRSNGTTIGHEPDVLPQGMTFHAGELGDAYVAGAKSGRDHQPTDEQIARARDAYVKHAHLIRLTAKET